MKKITLVLSVVLVTTFFKGFAQPFFYTKAPSGVTTTQVRAPNGLSTYAYLRACSLVLQSELTGIPPTSNTITSFGFTLSAGTNVATTGNFTVYLQNTSDNTYNKGTSWSTIISGMTQVYASTMTLPGTASTTSVTLTLATPFVYTGGGIYVAYDWYSAGSPYATTPATYYADGTTLIPGCASANSATSPPVALGTTAFRPNFLFGTVNTYTNEISVSGVDANGRIPGSVSNSNSVTAFIRNNSGITKASIPVSLNVSGANTFANIQTVTNLASGATATVNFATFSPTVAGINTISVSVPSDESNTNNSQVYTQEVTCNEWALNPANVNYTVSSLGFNTNSGIIASTYSNPVNSTITAIKATISTATTSTGNSIWAALLSSTGAIVATSNTITLTNAMLGTQISFNFATPQALNAGSVYYLGIAQPANPSLGYFPLGTYTSAYVPYANYVTTTTLGSIPAPQTVNLGYIDIVGVFAPAYSAVVNSPTVTCGTQAVLIASAGNTYTWSGGPATSNYSVTPIATTIYTVNSNNLFGCANTQTAMVTVNPLTVTAASSSPSVCSAGSVTITSSGASSYTWSGASSATTASFVANPTVTSTYSVTGGNAAGCAASANINVTVGPSPTITSASQTVVCGTQATLVASTSNGTYTWSSGPSNANYLVTPTVNTTYSVTGTSTAGCTASKTVAVAVNPLTVTAASSSPSVCSAGSVTITGSGASSYTWSGASSATTASFVANPTVTSTYSVTGGNAAGCAASANINVTVGASPTITSASQTVVCGTQATLVASTSSGTYTWSSGPSNANYPVTPTVSTTYSVTGTSTAGCTASKTVAVAVNPLTVTAASSSPSVCSAGSVTITGSGASSYTWSGASSATTASFVANPTVTSTYSVTGGNAAGCAASANINVTVGPSPTITSASQTVVCGTQATLVASTSSGTYTWSSGPSNANYPVTPTVNTTYSLAGTGANGCVSTQTVAVAITPITITAASSSSAVCAAGSVTLTGGGASSYTWSGAASATTASFVANPTVASTYSVTGANAAGCSNTANVSVVINANPTITAVSQTVVCGTPATLVASTSSGTYTWTSGPSNTNYLVTPTVNTTYSVSGTNAAGCTGSGTVAVSVNPITVTAVSNASAVCAGVTVNVSAGGANLYLWSAGPSTTSASFTDMPVSTTTYSVGGANLAGCTGTAAVTVIVKPIPSVTVNSGSICAGKVFTLIAAGADTYTYSSVTNTVSPLVNTNYSVTGTNSLGCVSFPAVSHVTVYANPTISVNSGTICAGQVFTISPSGASTYTYSGGSNTVSPTSDSSYTVTGASSEGCVSQAPAISSVVVNANPTVSALSNKPLICVGESAVITASGAATYSWSTTSSSASIAVSPTASASYTVEGIDANNCKASAVITQSVDACTGLNAMSLIQESDLPGVYPNPNNGLFFVEVSSNTDLVVFNSLGAVVLSQSLQQGKNQVDINMLSRGVYFAKMSVSGKHHTMKLIKD